MQHRVISPYNFLPGSRQRHGGRKQLIAALSGLCMRQGCAPAESRQQLAAADDCKQAYVSPIPLVMALSTWPCLPSSRRHSHEQVSHEEDDNQRMVLSFFRTWGPAELSPSRPIGTSTVTPKHQVSSARSGARTAQSRCAAGGSVTRRASKAPAPGFSGL